jgi:ectoine hydroxylase-related dioxygenase (phytanoyl-CoA dioxygenase family)
MDDLDGDGYALADMVLAKHQCEHMASSLPAVIGAGRGGIRNLITHPTVIQLLHHQRLGSYLWSVIGRDLVAVKATLFDKTTDSNWRAQWHQDCVIAVKERMQTSGYGSWSMKAGVLHAEAPAEVLSQMIAIRVHIDECGVDNGPLLAIPGSHRAGKLQADALAEVVAASPAVELYAPQGTLLLMRPLLVHSSSPARAPQHRRVLHIELAPPEAISPLQWHSAIPLRRVAA